MIQGFSKYFKRVFTFSLLVGLSCLGYGQGFVIDTTEFFMSVETLRDGPIEFDYDQNYEDELTEDEVDGFEGVDDTRKDNFLSGDLIFVPSDIISSARWDTLYIRTGRTDFSKLEEPRYIILNNPEEGRFCFPFKGKLISPYGPRGKRFHAGADIKLEDGDTVRAAFSGKVRIARVMSGYGKMVVVRHNNGLETVYAHLSKILVRVNQEVKAGETLGLGGRTGRASTSHLHFETRYMGEHFNPDKIINFNDFCLSRDTLIITREFFGIKASSTSNTAIADHSPKSNSASATTVKYHTIKSGDTLYALALRYKTTVAVICKLNGISASKKLKVGTRLRVK
jgi:hypothetical protein